MNTTTSPLTTLLFATFATSAVAARKGFDTDADMLLFTMASEVDAARRNYISYVSGMRRDLERVEVRLRALEAHVDEPTYAARSLAEAATKYDAYLRMMEVAYEARTGFPLSLAMRVYAVHAPDADYTAGLDELHGLLNLARAWRAEAVETARQTAVAAQERAAAAVAATRQKARRSRRS